MADEDVPPPLPSSPPPMAEPLEGLSDSPARARPSSERFRALQKKLSSSNTMYSNDPQAAAPPTERAHAAAAELEENSRSESPSLTHHTRERPRRKARAPSRTLLREKALSTEQDNDEGTEDAPPLPPPPPSSAPPEVPSPELLLRAGRSPARQGRAAGLEGQSDSDRNTASSTPLHQEIPPNAGTPISNPSSRPGSGIEAKRMAIGSFSDRLKKIRKNRAITVNSPKTTPPALRANDTSSPQLDGDFQIPLGTLTSPPPAAPVVMDTPRKRTPPLTRPKPSVHRTTGMMDTPRLFPFETTSQSPPHSPPLGGRDSPPPPPLPSSPPPLPTSPPPDLPSTVPHPLPQASRVPSPPADPSTEQRELMNKLDRWKRRSECLDSQELGSFLPPLTTKPTPMKEDEEEPLQANANRRSVSELVSKFDFPKPSEVSPLLPESSPPALPASPPPPLPTSPPPAVPHLTPGMVAMEPDNPNMSSPMEQGIPASQPTERKHHKPKLPVEESRALAMAAARKPDANPQQIRVSSLEEQDKALSPSSPPGDLDDLGVIGHPSPHNTTPHVLNTSFELPGNARRTPLSSTTAAAYRNVKIISEGGTLQSPDLKFTRVAMKHWSKPIPDELFASASTGDILSAPRKSSLDGSGMQKASSLKSFGSSSESLTFDDSQKLQKPLSPLIVSRAQEGSRTRENLESESDSKEPEMTMEEGTKVRQGDRDQRSSFVDSVLASIPPVSCSNSSSQENILRRRDIPEEGMPLQGDKEEVRRRRKGMQSVGTVVTEASIHRQELEAELQAPMSSRLASMERMQQSQHQLLEGQLVEMRQHQVMEQGLLDDSPGPLRPPTLFLDRDIFETSPDGWTAEQVCQWLELIGLGMYRQAFRDKGIDGGTLLHLDIQQFEELGIDSPEVREIFLAKIYELGNPGASSEMEDDFLLSVDSYTAEDWKKLQAAVDALKNPVLDDTVELQPSAFGQLQGPYPQSHSTPNIRRLNTELKFSDKERLLPSHDHDGIPVSVTVQSFPTYAAAGEYHWSHPHSYVTASPLREPLEQRERSHTTPTSMTYTANASYTSPVKENWDEDNREGGRRSEIDVWEGKSRDQEAEEEEDEKGGVLALAHKLSEGNILFEGGKFTAKKHRGIARGPSYWDEPPSGQETGLIRLFMDSVQEGSHYKAFLATHSMTAERVVRQALEKARMPDDPNLFCIWEVAATPTGSSRTISSDERPLTLQTQWPHYSSHHFELRVKDSAHQVEVTVELPDWQGKDLMVAMETHIPCPEAVSVLLSHLDPSVKEVGNWILVEENSRTGYKRVLEPSECPAMLQRSWPSPHTQLLKLIPRAPQVEHASGQAQQGVEQLSQQLLAERKQQGEELEGEVARKEATIHHLRQEKEEEGSGGNKEFPAPHKRLEAAESASRQQQVVSESTISQLREQISRLTLEDSRREQFAFSIRTEKDRLLRENQTKDALIQSLELDVAHYRTLSSPLADDSTTLSVLERSLSAHERALGSLREEHQRQTIELRAAEKEVNALRQALGEKENELNELKAKQLECPSLHSLVALPPSASAQCLVSAEMEPAEQGGLGIKMADTPSGQGGCVITDMVDYRQLKDGDRLLEVNGRDVSTKTCKEVSEFMQTCQGTVKVVVSRLLPTEDTRRDSHGGGPGDEGAVGVGSPSGMVIARFKRLSASLNTQLDSQSAETEHWRQQCERLKAEVLKYSTIQKDKELELSLLQSAVHDLRQQLDESERSRSQLRETLGELEKGRQSMDTIEAALRGRDGEIAKLRATEKQKAKQLRTAQKERARAVKTLRQCVVSSNTTELPDVSAQSEALTQASQPEVLLALRNVEDELVRHKAYLDQLLSVVLDRSPDILTKLEKAHRTRDHIDSDSWC